MNVFHLSPIRNRASIVSHGLIAKAKKGIIISYEPRIFVSNSEAFRYGYAIDYVGYEGIDVWQFDIMEDILQPDEFSGHKNHFYIMESVSPERLCLHESF